MLTFLARAWHTSAEVQAESTGRLTLRPSIRATDTCVGFLVLTAYMWEGGDMGIISPCSIITTYYRTHLALYCTYAVLVSCPLTNTVTVIRFIVRSPYSSIVHKVEPNIDFHLFQPFQKTR